jgi:hypothetical protein
MSSASSSSKPGSGTIKNILVGVITTVAATAIIYYLNIPEPSAREETKKKKEATEKDWNTYSQNRAIFSDVLKKMDDGSPNIEKRRTDINHEIDATVTSMENIKKDALIDPRINTMVDISNQQMLDLKSAINSYFDEMLSFAAKNPTEAEGHAFITQLGGQFISQVKNLKSRDSLRMSTYSAEIKKEYKLE